MFKPLTLHGLLLTIELTAISMAVVIAAGMMLAVVWLCSKAAKAAAMSTMGAP